MKLVIVLTSLLCLIGRAAEDPVDYYVVPLNRELAEAINEVSTENDLRVDELMQAGFVFSCKKSVRLQQDKAGNYSLRALMTHSNALALSLWIARYQRSEGYMIKADKKKIKASLVELLNDPIFKSRLKAERELDAKLQKVRDEYN